MRLLLSSRAVVLMSSSVLLAGSLAAAQQPPPKRPEPLPLDEAKRMVRMMDDIYKAGVLTTHRMYVQDPGTAAAVTWAKQVIAEVQRKGWPEARIFASTDRPLNPENRVSDAFEREALEAFRQGKTVFEKVEPGQLRFASDIRVTEKSCLTCHVRNKEGDLLGGVSYRALLLPRKDR
jgi:hypothetical protein